MRACGATRARAAGGRRGGGGTAPNPARHGTPLPNGGEADGHRPRPRAQARAAPWRGRGPSPRGRAPTAGAGSARRGARADASRAGTRARTQRSVDGDHDGWPGPERHSGAPFPNGAARRGTAPRAQHATTPQRRGGGGHGAESRGGPGRRHATAGRGPRDGVGQGVRDGGDEARRPPPGQRGAGGWGRRGGDGLRGGRGTGATARWSRGPFSLGEKERKGRTRPGSESVRRIGTTRGLTAREAPPQAHGRSRGNPRNADWLFPPETTFNRPRGGARPRRPPAAATASDPRAPRGPRVLPPFFSRAHAAQQTPAPDDKHRAPREHSLFAQGRHQPPPPEVGGGPRGDTRTAGGRLSGRSRQTPPGGGGFVASAVTPGRGRARRISRGCGSNNEGRSRAQRPRERTSR